MPLSFLATIFFLSAAALAFILTFETERSRRGIFQRREHFLSPEQVESFVVEKKLLLRIFFGKLAARSRKAIANLLLCLARFFERIFRFLIVRLHRKRQRIAPP